MFGGGWQHPPLFFQVATMKTITAFGACLALAGGTWMTGVSFGQSAEQSVVECTHVADMSARLWCYDDHMKRLGHKIASDVPAALTPAPATPAPATSAPATPA